MSSEAKCIYSGHIVPAHKMQPGSVSCSFPLSVCECPFYTHGIGRLDAPLCPMRSEFLSRGAVPYLKRPRLPCITRASPAGRGTQVRNWGLQALFSYIRCHMFTLSGATYASICRLADPQQSYESNTPTWRKEYDWQDLQGSRRDTSPKFD